jgi:hypothetical protein
VLEHVGVGRDDPGLGDPRRDRVLRRLVDVERDVVERGLGHRRAELLLIAVVHELKERERAAVLELEEAVAVGADLAEQLVRLAPGRDQRQADDVLVERARLLEILGHVRRVVQPGGTGRHRLDDTASAAALAIYFIAAVSCSSWKLNT